MDEVFSEVLTCRLRALVDLLLEVNQQFNLTSIRDVDQAWTKHVLDSTQALSLGLFEGASRIVDVGSGAGFPGLPLALCRPQITPTFLEATRKKCGFIQRACDEFCIKGQIINARAEEAGHDSRFRAQYDVATARAVGSLMEVAEYCLPLVRVGGHVVLWRGKDAESEARDAEVPLDTLGGALADVVPYELPGLPLTYHLVVLRKMEITPRDFPRGVGLPKTKPLQG